MSEVGINFGWDQGISADWVEQNAGFKNEILENGKYLYKIIKLEKKSVKQGKYANAPMAEIHYECGGSLVKEWIILNTDFKRKIANLLKAVFGAENPPAGFWDQLVGRDVKLEIEKVEDTYEGRTFFKNQVKAHLDKTVEHQMGAYEVKPQEPTTFGGSATGNSAPKNEIPPMDDSLPF